MSLEITLCGAADWAELKVIRLAALLDSPLAFGLRHADQVKLSDADWQARAAGQTPARYWLARQDGRVIGLIGMVWVQQHPELIAMWVHPDARGKGVADPLIAQVLQHAKAAGAEHVHLLVSPDNQAASRLYLRNGFVWQDVFQPLEHQPEIVLQQMVRVLY